jgi:hypothetical protein
MAGCPLHGAARISVTHARVSNADEAPTYRIYISVTHARVSSHGVELKDLALNDR